MKKSIQKFSLLLFIFIISCGKKKLYREIGFAMDTYVEIKIEGVPKKEEIIKDTFNEIKRIERIFNSFDKNSFAWELNKNKKKKINSEIKKVIETSLRVSKLTDGYFDLSIFPLSKIWKECIKNKKLPEKEKIEEIMKNLFIQKF